MTSQIENKLAKSVARPKIKKASDSSQTEIKPESKKSKVTPRPKIKKEKVVDLLSAQNDKPVARPKIKKEKVLTQKRENFCLAYVESGCASDAYKKAFSFENMKRETIWSHASKLMAKDEIINRIKELREPVVQKVQMTLEKHLEDLRLLRDEAIKRRQYGYAINAERARAKAAGLTGSEVDVQLGLFVKNMLLSGSF